MVEYIVDGKLVHAKFHIGEIVQIKPSMRWYTRWCYPGKWIVHSMCSGNNIMIFKHYTGELRVFNDEYFEPYISTSSDSRLCDSRLPSYNVLDTIDRDNQIEYAANEAGLSKSITDYTFVETLLIFRKYSRQNNWRMFLYFVKLCFLYIKRVIT